MHKTKTILVVDDDAAQLEQVVSHLESAGYRVVEAPNGLQGLEVARKVKPDGVIVDTRMPVMNGFKLARLLKFDTRFSAIPIIMIVGESESSSRAMAAETGVKEIVTKPIDYEEFLKRLEACLTKDDN